MNPVLYALQVVALIAGLVLLIAGYRKSNRDWMLIGALLLLAAGVLADVVRGFIEGLTSATH